MKTIKTLLFIFAAGVTVVFIGLMADSWIYHNFYEDDEWEEISPGVLKKGDIVIGEDFGEDVGIIDSGMISNLIFLELSGETASAFLDPLDELKIGDQFAFELVKYEGETLAFNLKRTQSSGGSVTMTSTPTVVDPHDECIENYGDRILSGEGFCDPNGTLTESDFWGESYFSVESVTEYRCHMETPWGGRRNKVCHEEAFDK